MENPITREECPVVMENPVTWEVAFANVVDLPTPSVSTSSSSSSSVDSLPPQPLLATHAMAPHPTTLPEASDAAPVAVVSTATSKESSSSIDTGAAVTSAHSLVPLLGAPNGTNTSRVSSRGTDGSTLSAGPCVTSPVVISFVKARNWFLEEAAAEDDSSSDDEDAKDTANSSCLIVQRTVRAAEVSRCSEEKNSRVPVIACESKDKWTVPAQPTVAAPRPVDSAYVSVSLTIIDTRVVVRLHVRPLSVSVAPLSHTMDLVSGHTNTEHAVASGQTRVSGAVGDLT